MSGNELDQLSKKIDELEKKDQETDKKSSASSDKAIVNEQNEQDLKDEVQPAEP
jgi:hypothetical protein